MWALPPRHLVTALPLALLVVGAVRISAAPDEARLYDDLLSNYNKLVRPAQNVTDAVEVKLGVTLQEFELDVESNEIVLSLWMNYNWNDYRLAWDPEDFGLVQSMRLMPEHLWMPDIVPYNLLPKPRLDWLSPVPAVVSPSGDVLFVGPASTRTKCRRMHPLMEQFSCEIKFGSWSTDGYTINLTTDADLDISSLLVNPMWSIADHTMKRNELFYTCCAEPYISVTLTLDISPRSSGPDGQRDVWPNLAVTVTTILCLVSFLVPVDSHQKLTLPSLALITAGTAAVTEFGLKGTAEYRLHFLRVYHVYTYVALGGLLWAVLMLVLGRPRALRLPGCLRTCLRSWLSVVCCLSSSPSPEDKTLCHEWTALAEMLDRVAAAAFLAILLISGASVAF